MITLAALIPAFNEGMLIKRTLESLLGAGMNPRDIYVIDDGSTDDTSEKAKNCGVNVLRNPKNLGKAASVTNALRKLRLLARYTHVSFLDADTLVDHAYFKSVRARFKRDPTVDVVTGRPKSLMHNWLTAYRAYAYFIAHAVYKPAQSRFRAIMVAPGCTTTYSTKILRQVSWTGDTLTEDMDVTVQAALLGARIVYEPTAIVYTQDPSTLRDYIGQVGNRWYAGAWQVMRKHGILWKGWRRSLHWECRMLFGESLVTAVMIAVWLIAYREHRVPLIATTFGATAILAGIAAWGDRRADILWFSPFFPFLWLLDCALFISSSRYIVKRKKNGWFSVARYTNDNARGDTR